MADNLDDGTTTSFDRQDDVSTLRMYALRVVYFGNFVFLGVNVWPRLINPAKPMDAMTGVAFAFWAALSTLCALGLRYPLKMLPVLFMQLFYKAVWLLAVALPLWSAGQWSSGTAGMFKVFLAGAVADLLVIPWPYVFANYVKTPGDRWRSANQPSHTIVASPTRIAGN